MEKLFAIFMYTLGLWLGYIAFVAIFDPNEKAMAKCQTKYSYETCFDILNG